MQPRILLRPAGASGVYYSAHNLTQRPVDVEIPPASSLVNFPPVYARVQESKSLPSNAHGTSYFELAKQRDDDILHRYMAEAIADNRRAMAAAGLLELEDRSTLPERAPHVSSPPSVPSSETEAPHIMETILHLSKSTPRDSLADSSCPIVSIPNAGPPSALYSTSGVYPTSVTSQLNNTIPPKAHVPSVPVQEDIRQEQPTSSSVSESKIHEVPTSSAEIFTELLKAKRTKKARSSSKRREDKKKLMEIAARNAQLSQTFTQSILSLEHLTQKEKELSQYAHFATVLQNERAQSDQREQAQAQAIQLLLRRIADLEDLTRQQQMTAPLQPPVPPQPHGAMPGVPSNATAPPYPVPPYWPAQPAQTYANTGTHPPFPPYTMQRNMPCYPHEQMPAAPNVPFSPRIDPMGHTSVPLSHTHTSVIRTSQTFHTEDSAKTPLSKSIFKGDQSDTRASMHPLSADESAHDQEMDVNIPDLPVTDGYGEDAVDHRRMRFRAKVFTAIPPDPPSLPLNGKDNVTAIATTSGIHPGVLHTESLDFSPPIIHSFNIVKLPPRPAKKPINVPASMSDNLISASHGDVKTMEMTTPSPIDQSISASADKEFSLAFPRASVATIFPSNVPKNLTPVKTTEPTSEQSGDWPGPSRGSVNEAISRPIEQDTAHVSLHEKISRSSNSTTESIPRLMEQPEEATITEIAPELYSDQYFNNGDHAHDVKLSHSADEHTFKQVSSDSSHRDLPLAPNLEYDSKMPYPKGHLREADSPYAFQLSYDREANKDSSTSTSKNQKSRRIKFMDCSTSSSDALSSASKASTVSVEVVDGEEDEYKNVFRVVQNSNITGLHTTLQDSSSSTDQTGAPTGPRLGSNLNITGISPAHHSSISPRSLEHKSSAIKSGASGILDEQSAGKVASPLQSSSSSLALPQLNVESNAPSFGVPCQVAPPQKSESHNSEDILSDFTDLELELQQTSTVSGANQSWSAMNSLIENATNQASIFKRNLEEALRRSYDASLVADKVSLMSPEENEISVKHDRIAQQGLDHDNYLDLEDYESSFTASRRSGSLNEDLDRKSRISDVCAAKAPLTATALLSTIQKGLSAMSLSSRNSLNSGHNSLLVHSTESPRDYKLFLPNDSSIIGYQPEFVPPEDEYMIEDPELFPSHSLEDIEGSAPNIHDLDRIVAQSDITADVDLDTPQDGCSEDQSTHSGQYVSGMDAPCVNLDAASSSPCVKEPLENTTGEAVVFNIKRHGLGTSTSLASSSSVPSPKRTLASNQNQGPPRGVGFGIGQRKVYGATQSAPTIPVTQIQSDRTSSSDDFNVASLSSKTESTSPLKPTQVSKASFILLSQKGLSGETDLINPVASESEPSPGKAYGDDTRSLAFQSTAMPVADSLDHEQPNLNQELDAIPDLDLLASMSYIPDLNSTSISEEKLLKDHSSASSHVQAKFSVNIDVDGFDNFYELDVDLGEDGSEFEDL